MYMIRIIDVEVTFGIHVGILEVKVVMELSSIRRWHCLASVLHSRFDVCYYYCDTFPINIIDIFLFCCHRFFIVEYNAEF